MLIYQTTSRGTIADKTILLLSSLVPPTVTGVTVTERKTTSVSLMWDVDIQTEWTYVLYFQGKNMTFQANTFLSHELSGLQPGTEYSFSVVTNFFELNSKAYQGFIVTSKKILITVYLYSDDITRKELLLFPYSFQKSTVPG